jgi:hypothetical protein
MSRGDVAKGGFRGSGAVPTLGDCRLCTRPQYSESDLAVVQSPRLWNVAVLTVVRTWQVARRVSDENLLGVDAVYRRTRSRPGGA